MLSGPVRKLIQNFAAAARRLRVQQLIVGVRDPRTGHVQVFASPGTLQDENMRQAVAARFSLDVPADTAWPGHG